jgi:beta-lactamase superfamily II metal-dependent hydrolase
MEGAAAFGMIAGTGRAEETKASTLPDWREGFLDIHHICTGRGSSSFIVCPDGTTLLIDAGDMSGGRPDDTVLPRLPNGDRTPGEWIAAYIERFSKPLNRKTPALDYVLLSHFHEDHIGDRQKDVREKNGYALSGIARVAEHVGIGKLVDRGYPGYDFPSRTAVERSNPKFFKDYLAFVAYQRDVRKTTVEGFDVGSRAQFALRCAPERYARFAVQNIAANGRVGARTVFPRESKPDENMCSCVVKLSYGAFAYYSGGDCSGFPAKRDLETPVAEAVGRVDAMLMDHHAYVDSANPAFLARLRPQVMVIPVWDMWHPHEQAFARMTDRSIYPDERTIFATGLHAKARVRLGAAASAIRPQGHVVIRVEPDGGRFHVFVLDPERFAVLDATDDLRSQANA